MMNFYYYIIPILWSQLTNGQNTAESNPCQGQDGTFTVNPKGCEFFFYCHNGQALEAFCPSNFWFNEDSGICDKSENVDCTLNDAPPVGPQAPPIDQAPGETIKCPGQDTEDILFVGSSTDCGRYYICYHGVPRRQQCIDDLHWNAKINKCDHPQNAKCLLKPAMPICPLKGLEFFPHPIECDYFIYCLNGMFSVQQCPFYHHWDVTTQTCKWRNLARCASLKKSNF